MIAQLHYLVKDARRRAMMAIGRGIISAVDDTRKLQEVQLELLDGETAEAIERFQQYGFTSRPYAGAEAVMVSVGGLRSHGIVIAVEDRRYRLTGLAEGEMAIHDDQGQKVHLKRDGIYLATTLKVDINAGGDVFVTAGGDLTAHITGDATIKAASLALGDSGGPAVARVGDSVVAGVITSGSAKVTCA